MFSVKVEQSPKEWRNWSGMVRSRPKQIVYPASMEEVVSVVKTCAQEGRNIRVVGSGHSFTRLVQTDDMLVSLDLLQGITDVDLEAGTVEVWAGTKLKALGELLFAKGFSQENLGDINTQSIAGALSTGTHGTGTSFGVLSTQVVGMTVVTADGEVLECSAKSNADLFNAMRVSLGMLGIIVKMRLRAVPAMTLRYKSNRISVEECLANLDRFNRENRHFEFYVFPYADTAQVKMMNQTEEMTSGNNKWSYIKKMVVENGAFWLMSEGCRLYPKLCRPISRLSAQAVPNISEAGESHRIFATPRLVRFNEMEYNLPAEHLREAVEEARASIERNRFAVHFPIECRYSKGDDIWLSPAHGRDSAYIAVHMYKGMPHQEYFQEMERIFQRYGGRPHWGKMHTMSAAQLREAYPKWDDFLQLRARLDPQGIFLNPYLTELIGG
ncbi:MAG: D-arabinono-1,4-lactone oxidase [Clostridia bacterium]